MHIDILLSIISLYVIHIHIDTQCIYELPCYKIKRLKIAEQKK